MLTDLKREAYEANLALVRHGLACLPQFASASAIDRSLGIFAITPHGVDCAELRARDMILVDLDGKVLEGRLRPSSDTPTHRRLYIGFKAVGGIAHAHSPHATSFAQAARAIPMLGTTHADFFQGDVPVTRKLTEFEVSGAYDWETGNVIVERFLADDLDPLDYPGVLVQRHAPFTWGPSAAHAVDAAAALEVVAQMAMLSLQLAPKLRPVEPELLPKTVRRRGPTAVAPVAAPK
jgi:L-ribulose-5-phosphate 4-epimerase